jgi:AraC-like DNA-binding protein
MNSWAPGKRRIVDCPPLGRMIIGFKANSSGVPEIRTWDPYVVVFTISGRAWFRDTDGRRRDLVAGDALLLFPGLGHAFAPYPGEHWDEFFVIFSGPAFEPWYRERVLTPAAPVVRLEPVAWWLRRIQEAVGDVDEPVAGFTPIIRFQAVLADIAVALTQPHHDATSRWLERAKVLLDRTAAGHPDLRSVAQALGTSAQQLRKRFRALAGQTPNQWHAGQLMRRACEALKSDSVRHVADQLGFCDQFQFSRRFKQTMGIAPREFQQRFR